MPARKIDAGLIQRVMRINYEGSANLFAAVVPAMVERGQGHIAGVSSIAGYRGLPSSGPYSASKAALSTLLESLRLELPASGVAVTAIHPGFVKTPMTDKNPFWMPFMVPVDKAGRIIERGLRKKKREINFPWPMVLIVRALKWIPDFLYDLMMGSGARRSGLRVP
jgi:short-subunit dehydrogenase